MNSKLKEFYNRLDEAISNYTSELITLREFQKILDDLNKNEFGIKIDKSLVKNNRVDFNENGYVSYKDDDEDDNSLFLDSSY